MNDDSAGDVIVARNEKDPIQSPIKEQVEFKDTLSTDTMNLEEGIDYSFNGLPHKQVKKVLIIRSSRMWHIHSIIRSLRTNFDGVQIAILAQPSAQKELEMGGEVDKVFLYEGGNFNAFKIGRELRRRLRDERFDLCVIPYNNPYGHGYYHVHMIALLSGARIKVSCDKECGVEPLSVWRLSGLAQSAHAFADGLLLIGVIGLIVPAAALVAKLWRKKDKV